MFTFLKKDNIGVYFSTKMALVDASTLFCQVCNSAVDAHSCTNIFYVSLPHNGETLANFVMKELRLSTLDLRTPYLCLRCYNLFGMLEQAQWTAANIQCEILKLFQSNGNQKQSIDGCIDNIFKINEVVDNFSETLGVGQINVPKVLVTEHLLEKDLNSINVITSQVTKTSIIPNDIDIRQKVEYHVICNNEETKLDSCVPTNTYLENDKIANNIYKGEPIILSEDVSLFSDETVETIEAANQKAIQWQDIEDTLPLQYTTANENAQNESVTLPLPPQEIPKPEPKPAPKQKIRKTTKAGKITKYSKMPLKHTCSICDKKWRTATELRMHEASHSSLRPYMCEKCGKAYKHKHALQIHAGMHNGINPFRCNFCNKCFTQKGALQRHLPIHTGDLPFQCEICGKRFVHHTSYNMHALSHTGQKSYKCDVCDLTLLSTSHLKRHMRAHTGEKPYKCDLCGKSFAERYNLLAHQKTHDPGQISDRETRKQYKCNECKVTFTRKQKLDEHLKEQHAVIVKINEKYPKNVTGVSQTHESFISNGVDLLDSCVNEVWQSITKTTKD